MEKIKQQKDDGWKLAYFSMRMEDTYNLFLLFLYWL